MRPPGHPGRRTGPATAWWRTVDAVRSLPDRPAGSDAAARARHRTLLLLASGPGVLDRGARPGHVTASVALVDGAGNMLLVAHRALGRWLQPGGHLEPGEDVVAAAHREATEESGLSGIVVEPRPVDIDVHRVAPPSEDPHEHHDVRFLARVPGDRPPARPDDGAWAVRWVPLPEVIADGDLDPSLRRLARSAVRRLG